MCIYIISMLLPPNFSLPIISFHLFFISIFFLFILFLFIFYFQIYTFNFFCFYFFFYSMFFFLLLFILFFLLRIKQREKVFMHQENLSPSYPRIFECPVSRSQWAKYKQFFSKSLRKRDENRRVKKES